MGLLRVAAASRVLRSWARGGTLVLIDCRGEPSTRRRLATITCGPATHDLAYMIGGSFEPEQRARVERELLADDRSRLAAAGVEFDADALWRDYRISSLWGVIMSVAATMLAQETERGNRMFITMLRRHARHAIDLDALALVS